MKSFIAIAIFGLLAVAAAHPFTDEQVQKGREHAKKCIEESGIDPAVVQKLKAGDFAGHDEKAECFTFCFLREAGFVDDKGNQNEAVIVDKLSVDNDKTKVQALYEKCKNEKGLSPCNQSYNIFKCYRSAVAF